MKFIPTEFPGLYVIEPKIFKDGRGFFMESYKKTIFEEHGLDYNFIQDNHAKSEGKGVLRGLHFQLPPATQAKLVRVTRGAVYDVVVDLRAGSPTYGQWRGFELSEENSRQLLVPKGFAHGYQCLSEMTEFLYKVDAPYAPTLDGGLAWDDPGLGIDWPVPSPVLSEKDKTHPRLAEFESPFHM